MADTSAAASTETGAVDPLVAAALKDTARVLDCFPSAIVVIDREARIAAWNAVSATFYGWSAEEAVGRSLHDVVTPPELLDAGRSIVERALSGQPWSGDIKVALRGGDRVRTFATLGPLTDADGAIVGAVCAVDDHSQLHELTVQASGLADRLVLALSAGQLGTWHWDARSGAATWDPMMEQIFGLPDGGFAGTFDHWVQLLHPDDRDEVLRTLHDAVDTHRDYEVEHRVIHPDGTLRWLHGRGKVLVDERGEVTGTIGCLSDVTERKVAETESRRRVDEAEAVALAERTHRERLEFLTKLNDVALTAASPRALMANVAKASIPQLGDWCSIHFRPEAGAAVATELAHVDPLKVRWARAIQARFPFDPDAATGVAAVLRTGVTQFVPSVATDVVHSMIDAAGGPELRDLHDVVDELHLTSSIIVPMITRRAVVGAIQFVSAESGRHYTDDDVSLAEAVAGRVGESLVNAWLIDQQHHIAGTLQAALLPPLIPQIDGVDIATRYWAAGALTEVGGDFYDVFPIGPDRWAIVIGDVCGTGPRAAAVTSIARHTIRAAATHGQSHAEVMRWVNDAIINSNKNTFCTVIYSTLERSPEGRWRYTTAIGGHPRPILSSAEQPARLLGTYGTLIGIVPRLEISVDSYELETGDAIILYTDGVTDLRPPHALTEEQLARLIGRSAASRGSADAIAATIGEDIEALMPIVERHDDVALLVVRID